MNPRWKYLVAPCGQEYNNLKIIAGKSLILNTSLEDAKYVNRIGVVLSTPKIPKYQSIVLSLFIIMFSELITMLKENKEKAMSILEFKVLVDLDRIYMFNDGEGWKCTKILFLYLLLILYKINNYIGQTRMKKSMWEL